MFKRTLFFCLLTIGQAGLFTPTLADADPVSSVAIRGRAQFERRSTVVPMHICMEGEPCPKPEVYWSLMIINSDDGKQYEIDEPFALGSPIAPEAIEISGVMIRNGSRVVMEGTVETVSVDYAYVTEIKNIRVIVDLRPAVLSGDRHQANLVDPFNAGWSCRGGVTADGTSLHAQVWYSPARDAEESFKMRVFRRDTDGGRFRQIANYADIAVSTVESNVLYRGAGQASQVLLAISQVTDKLFDLPSELWMAQQGTHIKAHLHTVMVCNRLRVF